MRTRQLRGILLLFGIIVSAMIYKGVLPQSSPVEPELRQAQILYEQNKLLYAQDKIQLQRKALPRNDRLKFYGAISLLAVVNLALLIIAGGIARANVKRADICTVQIGQHSRIPVRYKDLPRVYQIALNLSLAEIEASRSRSHDQAYQMSRQMIQDMTHYTRARAGEKGWHPFHAALGLEQTALPIPPVVSAPSVAELLRNGALAPGKPLVIGYTRDSQDTHGQPQYRELQDLKSVAVAGWQGSGKTRSMAYFIASSVLAYGVRVYVVDPHQQHEESLGALIRPLTRTGRVRVMNPFDTPALIQDLNRHLDRRLAGQESNEPGILLVIDELARLATLSCFDQLLRFLERCTEETRKANITFLGASPKWTARHFKGRADIRGCMNSMLIHKCKPSQAHLLLEDAQEKNLVKHLQRPGEAILVTDYAPPAVVTIPYCCRQDMETVAQMVGERQAAEGGRPKAKGRKQQTRKPEAADRPRPGAHMIFLGQHQHPTNPSELTVEQIRMQIVYRKQQDNTFTQASVARQAGITPSLLSRILTGKSSLTDECKQKLYVVLFGEKAKDSVELEGILP